MSEPVDNFDAAEAVTETVTRRKRSATAEEIQRVDSKSAKKIKIHIAKTKDDKSDVYVAVNGTSYLIQRGVNVEVPDYLLSTLNDAVVSTLDEDTGEYVDIPRIPVSVVG